MKKACKLQWKSVIEPEKDEPMEISVTLTIHWVTIRKAIEYHEKDLKIAIEIGDRAGEGRAYHNIGNGYLWA